LLHGCKTSIMGHLFTCVIHIHAKSNHPKRSRIENPHVYGLKPGHASVFFISQQQQKYIKSSHHHDDDGGIWMMMIR
jgi:hypothetical protein